MSIFPKTFISQVSESIGLSNGVNESVESLLIEDAGLLVILCVCDL